MTTRRLRLSAATLALASGCGPLFIEATAPRVCITEVSQRFPGESEAVRRTLRLRLTYRFGEAVIPPGSEEVRAVLLSVTVVGRQGSDMGFAEEADISAADSAEPEAELSPLLHYERTGTASRRTLTIEPDSPVDVARFVKSREITLGTAITGTLPERPFTMDVTACFSVSACVNCKGQ